MIPLMKAECVEGRSWLTDDQFLDALAMSGTLPGPISAKMSLYVGLKVGGPLGALVAFTAVMAPSMLLMGVLASVYMRTKDHPAVQGAMAAVQPVVVGMLAWTVVELAPGGIRGWSGAALALGAVVALWMEVHPALVILGALGLGAVALR
jgi:chromate transporter